jgi:hypothetical protein
MLLPSSVSIYDGKKFQTDASNMVVQTRRKGNGARSEPMETAGMKTAHFRATVFFAVTGQKLDLWRRGCFLTYHFPSAGVQKRAAFPYNSTFPPTTKKIVFLTFLKLNAHNITEIRDETIRRSGWTLLYIMIILIKQPHWLLVICGSVSSRNNYYEYMRPTFSKYTHMRTK